jgi:hypothetical protein
MAYTYIWPISLPQSPQKNFAETGGALILRTPMDSGPAKQRRRGKLASKMTLSFIMTSAQVTTLENFVTNDIKGTARFGFTHPRTNQVVEVRIIPSPEGEMYTASYLAPGYYNISTTFEILP